ncbi:hypothetical protein D3C76_983860 [compost metagenome]
MDSWTLFPSLKSNVINPPYPLPFTRKSVIVPAFPSNNDPATFLRSVGVLPLESLKLVIASTLLINSVSSGMYREEPSVVDVFSGPSIPSFDLYLILKFTGPGCALLPMTASAVQLILSTVATVAT